MDKTWHTQKNLEKEDSGIANFSGFFGGYDIYIRVDVKYY